MEMDKRKTKWTRDNLDISIQSNPTGAKLLIEYPDYYEEDYQIPMLQTNTLSHILNIKMDGIGTISRFSNDIRGMISMRRKYEKEKISYTDLQNFLTQFLDMLKILQSHMLETKQLFLTPDNIFFANDTYYFCYLPVTPVSLSEQFHGLTEFFVKQIDYSDMECIFLAHKLNQESMEEQYDIEAILNQYYIEASERKQEQPIVKNERKIEEPKRRDYDEKFIYEDISTIREMGGFHSHFEKITSRIKKKRWGGWQDLILESDRQ